MNRFAGVLLFAICLIAAAVLIGRAPQWGDTAGKRFDQAPIATATIGHIVSVDGRASLRPYGAESFTPVTQGQAIHQLDTFQVQSAGRLEVELTSGFKLSFQDKAQGVFELSDPNNPQSPVYLHLLIGQADVVSQGTA